MHSIDNVIYCSDIYIDDSGLNAYVNAIEEELVFQDYNVTNDQYLIVLTVKISDQEGDIPFELRVGDKDQHMKLSRSVFKGALIDPTIHSKK